MQKKEKIFPLLASLLGGLMLAMCYPGLYVASELVWLWAVPVLFAIWYRSAGNWKLGFQLGCASGLAFWLLNTKWIIAMGNLETVPMAGALLGWLLLSAYLSLYVGAWGAFAATLGNPWSRSDGIAEVGTIAQRVQQRMNQHKQFVPKVMPSFRVMGFALINAAAWVVLEWLRSWIFTGFHWNGLGVAFHDVPVMMQCADVIGVTGLAFLPVFFAAVVVQTGRRLVAELRSGKFQLHLEIGAVVLLLALCFGYGVKKLAYYGAVDSREISTMIIQQNIKQSLKWDEELEAQHYLEYIEAIDAAMLELENRNEAKLHSVVVDGGVVEFDRVDLLVLPESSMTQPLVYLDGDQSKIYFPMLTKDALVDNILARHPIHLVFGSNLLQGINKEDGIYYHPEGDSYNAFLIAKPDLSEHSFHPTEQLYFYGKNHLVPFGEYLPEIPLLAEIMEVLSGMPYGRNFARGGVFEPLQLEVAGEPLDVIPSICYEDTVGRLTRQFVRDRDQVIINITNDGWFGESEGAIQHLSNAKFRAVELRRPLLRAANTGVSGVVDVTGSMWKDSQYQGIGSPQNPFVRGSLYAKVKLPKNPEVTVYAIFGDWFVLVCAMVVSIASGIVLLRKRVS